MKQRGRKSSAQLSVIPPYQQVTAYDRLRTQRESEPPPEHLTAATKAWWKQVTADYALERHQFRILQTACEAFDRKEEAREALIEHGLTFTDNKGMIRARPEIQIERDSRVAFLRAIRELDFDVETPVDTRQPSALFR